MANSRIKPRPASLLQIAQKQPGLGSAIRQAEAYQALNRRILPLLPENVQGHIQIACIEQNCLMIAAESSAWATRARMLTDQILAETNKLWPKPISRTEVFIAGEAFRVRR